MQLAVRPAEYALPSYSLTGDLLGFMRCGLQYRYTRIGRLPASRPVQMWFGSFLHGVMEEAYRRFDQARRAGRPTPPPWPDATITEICDLIKRRLAAQNLYPWTEDLEQLGYARAKAAINDLGPQLFPLIHRAEVRLTGTRPLPVAQIDPIYRFRAADRYEMVGIIDVITHVELSDPALQGNQLLQLIREQLPGDLPERFEVIIDYKGMRRPPLTEANDAGASYWNIYGWQVQTYAHLRSTHEDSLPIVAGIILYVNELLPTRGDFSTLRREVQSGLTDVAPAPGSLAEQILRGWREREELPTLPVDFRLRRTTRIVPVSPPTIQNSLVQFDAVVARIETCRGRELNEGRVIATWEKNSDDEDTCVACDARTFCPSYTKEDRPRLPAVRPRIP